MSFTLHLNLAAPLSAAATAQAHAFPDKGSLQAALARWCAEPESDKSLGPISSWNVTAVTDMEGLVSNMAEHDCAATFNEVQHPHTARPRLKIHLQPSLFARPPPAVPPRPGHTSLRRAPPHRTSTTGTSGASPRWGRCSPTVRASTSRSTLGTWRASQTCSSCFMRPRPSHWLKADNPSCPPGASWGSGRSYAHPGSPPEQLSVASAYEPLPRPHDISFRGVYFPSAGLQPTPRLLERWPRHRHGGHLPRGHQHVGR